MGAEKKYTQEQISALMRLMVLDEYNEQDFTFDEKLELFLESIGIERDEFEVCVDFWTEQGIFEYDAATEEVSVSEKGKKVFSVLSAMRKCSDETITNVANMADAVKQGGELVKKHGLEVAGIVTTVLSILK